MTHPSTRILPARRRQEVPDTTFKDFAASFVPLPLRMTDPDGGPAAGEAEMVLVWFDIAGFTQLSGSLFARGQDGIEALGELLNDYYGMVLGTVTAWGGQPLMFAGDGLLSGWPCGAAPRAAALRAVRCAGDVVRGDARWVSRTDRPGLYAVLAMGPCRTIEVGPGSDGRPVSLGRGVRDVQATALARIAGRVVLSAPMCALLGDAIGTAPAGDDAAVLLALRERPAPPPPPPPVPRPAIPAVRTWENHLPLPLAGRTALSQLTWVAELRRVSVVFVNLPALDGTAPDAAAQLEEVAAVAVRVVRRHEGWLQQMHADESGISFLVLFGTPPVAHADAGLRAVRCGIDLDAALHGSGRRCGIGVASGQAFCSVIGTDALRSYTAIGEAINCAARLMKLPQDGVCCDDATRRIAGDGLAFTAIGQTRVHGIAGSIQVWTPLRQGPAEVPARTSMVGRGAELAILLSALDAARSDAAQGAAQGTAQVTAPGIVLLEAETGAGKSRLLEEFARRAAERRARVLPGSADRTRRRQPYHAWRDICERLLGLEGLGEDERRDVASRALGPDLAAFGALLDAVLPVGIPATPQTQALAQPGDMLVRLLLALLRRAAAAATLLLVIDDAHWLDDASWALAQALAQAVVADRVPLCLVLAMQPPEDRTPIEPMLAAGARRMLLEPLTDDDQDRLVLARLGAEHLEPELGTLIRARARGHAFFCAELAHALHEEGAIEIVSGTCVLARHLDPAALRLPETVQGAVLRRIDHLAAGPQLTLKVTSAAGERFPTALVLDVHPEGRDGPDVAGHLRLHERVRLLRQDVIQDAEGYAFQHGIIRDVAYGLMLPSQRRRLHHSIADWYERDDAHGGNRPYALLAYHLEAAGENERAADALQMEAGRIFSLGLAREAVAIGLQAAHLLAHDLPTDPAAIGAAIVYEQGRIAGLLDGRAPDQLAALPPLADERVRRLIRLLLFIAPFAHQSEQVALFALLSVACLRLTLEHGNGPSAAEVYAMYSVTIGAMGGDRPHAAEWNRLALRLAQGGSLDGAARCAFIQGWFHQHWVGPLEQGIALTRRGAEAGAAGGEGIFECFNLAAEVVLLAAAGRTLDEVIGTARTHLRRNGERVLNSAFHCRLEMQLAKALAGRTAVWSALSDDEFDEARDLAFILDTSLSNQIGYFHVGRLKLHVLFGDWAGGLPHARAARAMLSCFAGQPAEFEVAQFGGIAALAPAAFGTGAPAELLDEGRDCARLLRRWEGWNPGLFGHKADLVEALVHRAEGRGAAALALLERAADRAAGGGFAQDVALAWEHAARCRRADGDAAGALVAARRAADGYRAWGAVAVADRLAADFTAGSKEALLF